MHAFNEIASHVEKAFYVKYLWENLCKTSKRCYNLQNIYMFVCIKLHCLYLYIYIYVDTIKKGKELKYLLWTIEYTIYPAEFCDSLKILKNEYKT